MRKSFIIGAVVALGVSAASAQTQNPPAQSGPNNPAVNTTQGNTANQPVAGANSFTEGQAKSRIEENGFTSVSELKKDDNGVCRGVAKHDGKSCEVAIDYKGNVVFQT